MRDLYGRIGKWKQKDVRSTVNDFCIVNFLDYCFSARSYSCHVAICAAASTAIQSLNYVRCVDRLLNVASKSLKPRQQFDSDARTTNENKWIFTMFMGFIICFKLVTIAYYMMMIIIINIIVLQF